MSCNPKTPTANSLLETGPNGDEAVPAPPKFALVNWPWKTPTWACFSGSRAIPCAMRSLTIKLAPEQTSWLEEQARALRRSKGDLIREMIEGRQARKEGSLGHVLSDLCGCLNGSSDLSTRPLKGYGRS